MSDLNFMPMHKNERIQPWLDSQCRWVVYVFGYLVTRNGKARRFKSEASARKAGESYLAYVRETAGV